MQKDYSGFPIQPEFDAYSELLKLSKKCKVSEMYNGE